MRKILLFVGLVFLLAALLGELKWAYQHRGHPVTLMTEKQCGAAVVNCANRLLKCDLPYAGHPACPDLGWDVEPVGLVPDPQVELCRTLVGCWGDLDRQRGTRRTSFVDDFPQVTSSAAPLPGATL